MPAKSSARVQVFDAHKARFRPLRTAGRGEQLVADWLGADDGHPCTIGIGELRNIRISDYRFGFSDFLHVIEGRVRVIADGSVHDLRPGMSLHIPEGTVVTIEVPDRLLWLYVTHPSNWDGLTSEPGSVTEFFG